VLKFFLDVSKAEQRRRFLERVARPEKNWKFEPADLREHQYWDDYQHAYDAALRATSTRHEPWYVIPADRKWFLRTAVAAIIVQHLSDVDPQYPTPSPQQRREMQETAALLRAEA